jgi:hypothetical protein
MTGATSSSLTELLNAAFDEVIVPLARAGAMDRLDFAPTPANGSYFKAPTRAGLSRDEMLAIGRSGELEALAALWRAQGRHELLALAPRLQAIAAQLEALTAEEDNSGVPSALIYQMY